MAKTRLCIILLLCAVGFFTIMSCSQQKYTLRIEDTESGYYPVTVVTWDSTVNRADTPPTITFYQKYIDATTKVTASYAQSYWGGPIYPNSGASATHLDSFTLTWKCNPTTQKIPPTRGGLDVVVGGTPDGKTSVTFTITTIPAITKETCTALIALQGNRLQGNPGDPDYYQNGQLSARGTLTVFGTDLLTGDLETGVSYITGLFADYINSKTAH